ncbi:rhamnogalacturonan acetylesterase [uncultured Metabacillus sp.]|uniref:rhamnogalacturonan acetylesterase n=1 Tax=uncultured Metabacillus sp. TaxID=2860135 RepID=UPI002626A216|nr:rhamnogalacturonan acetylesterase [uncultured Metabacillus sp.]
MVDIKHSIYLAGDSTVANCPEHEAPMAGWGQVFQSFFTENVVVYNEAKGGRSSNSFIEEGRLKSILDRIQPNDYLFILGHNDQKSFGTEPYTTYQTFLSQYITGAREKDAHPILLTSVHRRKFDQNGQIENTLGDYPRAMMQLAERLDVPYIDLWSKTKRLYEALGKEGSRSLFTMFPPNVHPNYPDGIEDNTHFCENGAYEIAKLVIEGIKELQLPIAAYIKR